MTQNYKNVTYFSAIKTKASQSSTIIFDRKAPLNIFSYKMLAYKKNTYGRFVQKQNIKSYSNVSHSIVLDNTSDVTKGA